MKFGTIRKFISTKSCGRAKATGCPEGKGMILSAGKYNGVEVYVNGRLTPVIQPNKKMNIALDPFVEAAEH